MMSKGIGLIVEGLTEMKAFQRFAAKKNIRQATAVAGNSKPKSMAMHFYTLAKSLSNCKSIVVVVDREQRGDSCGSIESEIESELRKMGCDKVHVVLANRMVENWMLADVCAWKGKKYIKSNVKQKSYEGSDGVKVIKAMFVNGYSYQKTKDGVEFLRLINCNTAKTNSESFARFAGLLSM